MNRPPAFQFYPKDWDDIKIQRMSYEAQGICMRILCFMWKDSKDQCSILDDDDLMSKALGISKKKWLKAKTELMQKNDPIFKQNKNKLISLRLKKEAIKIKKYRKKQAEKGKLSGEIRRKRKQTSVEQQLNNSSLKNKPESNSSSSYSSSTSNKKKKEKKQKKRKKRKFTKEEIEFFEKEFEDLWKNYDPRGKLNEKYAKKRFIALCKEGELEEFKNGYIGYANFLKHKRLNETFDQKPKYFSTLVSDYKEYIGFKYKPRL